MVTRWASVCPCRVAVGASGCGGAAVAGGEGGRHPDAPPDSTGPVAASERRRRPAAAPGLSQRVQTEAGGARRPHPGALRYGRTTGCTVPPSACSCRLREFRVRV